MQVQVQPIPATFVDGCFWPVEHPYERDILQDYLERVHLAAGMRALGHRLMDHEADDLAELSPLPLTYQEMRHD